MGIPLRVLIVEDSEDDLLLMIHEIRSRGYDLTYVRVETAEDMREALLNHTWDVILSDYSMPRFSAPAAIKLVHDMGIDIPIIIVSGTVGEEAAVAAMKAGAQDFFSKHRLVRLIPAIERELREADVRRKRRWAEEQLHHAEQRFAKVFQAAPLGITITNRNGVFLDVNDFLLQESGYSRTEVIGKSSLELNFWLDAETRQRIAQVLDTGNIVRDMELRFRDKSGQMHDVLCSFTRIELAGQACLLSMFQDITERKRMEAERSRLLEQKQAATQEFQMTIERMTDGFVMLDREWRFRYVNPKACEILGRRAADLVGSNAWQIFPEAVDGPHYNALHKAADTQTTVEIEAYFEPWKRWYVNLIFPSPDGITIFFQDITQRKRQEQELLDAERLRMEIAKERELIQLKERFISIVSHEFRTPLTAIMSSAELVQRYYDHLPRERQLHHIGEVLSQASFMVAMLEDILLVNKGRAGKVEFKPEPLDLRALCQSIIEQMRVQDNNHHQLIVQAESELSGLVMDTRLLQHIVVNLLTNAIKYSPGGGDVRLEISRYDDQVTIRVSDRGIGIPPEAIARLYEPFQRADNVGGISGTGLGLAIVKESVDRHGGTIACQSEVGVGTTFTVRLPASPP